MVFILSILNTQCLSPCNKAFQSKVLLCQFSFFISLFFRYYLFVFFFISAIVNGKHHHLILFSIKMYSHHQLLNAINVVATKALLTPSPLLRFGRYVPFMIPLVDWMNICKKCRQLQRPQKINNIKIFLSVFIISKSYSNGVHVRLVKLKLKVDNDCSLCSQTSWKPSILKQFLILPNLKTLLQTATVFW